MSQATATPSPVGRPRWTPTVKVIIAVIALVLIGLAIFRFQIVFTPLIVGAIMAYILQPAVGFLQRRARLPRGLATALVFLLLLGLLAPIVASLTPVVVEQLVFLQGEVINFIDYVRTLSPGTTVEIMGLEIGVELLTNQVVTALTEAVRSAAPGAPTIVFGVAETVLLTIFTLLIGFYLTKDAAKVVGWVHGLVPPGYGEDLTLLLAEIDRVWSSFFRGQVILALIVTGIMTAVSAILGLPQPVLMGILAGFLEFLPSIGHAIWIITALILALLEGSSTLPVSNLAFALIVAGAHFGFTQFDLNFLIPRIIGREVNLHPMVVIIGIIVGAAVGGVLGVALAAPAIASLRIVARYVYAMLFDLDPFPMVGPPAASPDERQGLLASQMEHETDLPRTATGRVISRFRRRKAADDDGQSVPAPEPDPDSPQERTQP